ncbi:MAG: flagellar hook-basal body complex protein FliE [Pseudomonadota bacterium]
MSQNVTELLEMMRAGTAKAAARPDALGVVPGARPPTGAQVDFAEVLKNSIAQVDQQQHQAEQAAASFAAGDKNANLHEVMLALQKASISFQEMKEVRTKLVTAYHDIMNLPV